VSVNASRSLQQEIYWRKVADKKVEVQVERLFEHLSTDDDVARGPIARSSEPPCEPALAFQPVSGHESRVQECDVLGT
jgi:hypothetical protein